MAGNTGGVDRGEIEMRGPTPVRPPHNARPRYRPDHRRGLRGPARRGRAGGKDDARSRHGSAHRRGRAGGQVQ